MRKKRFMICTFISFLFVLSIITGCQNSEIDLKIENGIGFSQGNIVHNDFGGIGVELDVYENPASLTDDEWNQITDRLLKLKPSFIRCMTNFDWITHLDNKGNQDITDDTWEYYWTDIKTQNMFKILDFCQANNIKVAFGPWGEIWGTAWNMTEQIADARWAKVSADVMDYLVNTKKYTCIKWFIAANEPNYVSTWDRYKTGIENLYTEFETKGLNSTLQISGPDAANFESGYEWLEKSASLLSKQIENYNLHHYASANSIDNGKLTGKVKIAIEKIKASDKELGQSKDFYMWEAGNADGMNEISSSNDLIDTFSYGRRTVDFAMQCILGGMDGLNYWCFDDTMHYNISGGPVGWGMFHTNGNFQQQKLRPWYHASSFVTRAFSNGNIIYSNSINNGESKFRALASVDKDKKNGHIILVNHSLNAVEKNVMIEQTISAQDKIYVYIYNEDDLSVGGDGFIEPNFIFENSSLNKITNITVPKQSVVYLTTSPIIERGVK